MDEKNKKIDTKYKERKRSKLLLTEKEVKFSWDPFCLDIVRKIKDLENTYCIYLFF